MFLPMSRVEALFQHQFRDGVGVLEHLLVRLGRTDGRDDTLAYAGQHGVFAGTTHQLPDVGTHRYAGLGYQLYTVLGHGGNRRGVDYLGVYRHLHSLEHVAAGQVDGRCHLEAQVDVGFRGRYEGVNHAFYVTAGQVVSLEFVAGDVFEAGFVGFDHASHDDLGRNLTDTHQKELYE